MRMIKNNYYLYIKMIINYRNIIILLSITLWIINFFQYEGFPLIFRIAKAFGLNLRVWTMFMFFTMSKSILCGKVNNHVELHKILGYVITVCSYGHSISHIVFNKHSLNNQHIYGYILFGIINLIFVSFLTKSYSYSLFKYTHYLYTIWLFICILHVSEFKYWFIVPLLVYFVEILLNLNKTQICKIKNSNLMTDFIFLTLSRNIESVPGSYYYICVPSINLEFHPFSVSSSPLNNILLFIIETKGDWTKKLSEIVADDKNVLAIVIGPYLTTSSNIINDTNKKICISSGIGITPFVSVADSLIDNNKSNRKYRQEYKKLFNKNFIQTKSINLMNLESNNYHKQYLKIIWVLRDPKALIDYFEYLNHVMEDSENVYIDVYITSKTYNEESKKEFIEKYNNEYFKIFFQRPDFKTILDDKELKSIYYCGNNALKENLISIKNKDTRLYSEVFS